MSLKKSKYSKGKITLYHGTSTKFLDEILSKGLMPRYDRDTNWSENPSNPLMVYLSDAYPVYFAQQSAEENYEPVVLEVRVDTKRLYPDEDYLEQFTRFDPEWKSTVDSTSMEYRTEWFKENLMDYKDYYLDSLNGLGNCCHKGVIKPKNIIRYSILESDHILHYSDPTITLQNYMYVGERYRVLSAETMWEKPLSKEIVCL